MKTSPIKHYKQRIKSLETQLAQAKLQPELEAFGQRVANNYLITFLFHKPYSEWPETLKHCVELETRKTPTLGHLWKQSLQ